MTGCRRLGIVVAALTIAGAISPVHAATAEANQSTAAYRVLARFGLLPAGSPMVTSAGGSTGTTPAPAASPPAASAVSAAAEPDAETYGVLRRLGLLPADATAPASLLAATSAPVPASSPALAAAPAPAEPVQLAAGPATPSQFVSDAIEESAVSRAYALLRAKGLLPGGTPKGAHTPAIRQQRSGAERVLVDKSDRKLYLLRNGKSYKEYRISLGGVPFGPKVRRGDLRTPEGVYTLDWRNPRSRYYKSIHISYPNEQDRQRAAQLGVDPGGDIMLHGEHYLPALQRTIRRAKSQKDWTEGCIALNNEYIDEIWHEVADGTPIEIRP